MRTSDDLFQLVRSLTKTEKRHFKLHASFHKGDRQFIRLFDLVDSQPVYDEKAILEQFKGQKVLGNFSVAKAYLFDRILDSLESFHSNKTVDSQLRKMISQIRILITKKQYHLCEKLIIRARKLADAHDLFTYAYELSTIEETVKQHQNDVRWLEGNSKKLFDNERRILRELGNFQQYRQLTSMFFLSGTKGGRIRDAVTRRKFDALKKSKLMRSPLSALSNRAKISYYFLNGSYYYHIGEMRKSLDNFVQLKHFLEEVPGRRKQYFHSYLYTINNILSTGIDLLRFDELLPILRSVKDIRHFSQAENSGVMLRYYMNLCQLFVTHARFEEGRESVAEAEKWLEETSGHAINELHKITLMQNMSIILFANGELRQSLQWLNRVLNHPEQQIAADKQSFSRIFSLLLHFELGNAELLPYITVSTYRYLYKRNRLFKFETLILDFIRKKLPRISNAKEQAAAFGELKTALGKLSKNDYERKAFEHFDFIAWLQAKAEGKSFAEVARQRASIA